MLNNIRITQRYSEICGFHSRFHTCSICAPLETWNTSIWHTLSIILCRMRQTVHGGIWVSRLVLRNDFFGLCKISYEHARPSHLMFFCGRDPFLLHKQPSPLSFLCHVQIGIAVGDCLENSLTNACCTLLFDCDRAYPNTQNAFFLLVTCISISAKIKTSNTNHPFLTTLRTCRENEKKFER